MSHLLQSSIRNNFLARISVEDFSEAAGHLEHVELRRGQCIVEPNEALRYITFPDSGIVSIVVISPEGQKAEGGIIGREGLVSPFVLLGTDRSPNLLEVQMAGHGHRMETSRFLEIASKRKGFRTKALTFAHTLAIQVSFTAMLNAAHPVNERLARWLLMCHDRSDSDDLALTHRYLSVMLCVRRASVTVALQVLEENGLIRMERGVVVVTSRARLEEFADDAYGPPEAEYVRLMGPL